MFLSEAQMVGMLQHPQLMPIYDAGEEDGHCYVVTEYVHGGRTLAAFCKAGRRAAASTWSSRSSSSAPRRCTTRTRAA